MPACCVVGCSNRFEKGIRTFRFPRDPTRRCIWTHYVGRSNLPARAEICEVHFDQNQFENKRADGRKLLRSDAIPNLLEENFLKRQFDGSPSILGENVTKPQSDDEPTSEKTIKSENSEEDIHKDNEDISNYCIVEVERDVAEEKPNRRDKEVIINLRKRVKALLQENRNLRKRLKRRDDNFQKIFGEDQLKFIELGTHRGFTWSDETMDTALKLYVACGAKGYNELRQANLPYPSIRTLQDRTESLLSIQQRNPQSITPLRKA